MQSIELYPPDIIGTIRFVGTYDSKKEYEYGDVCIRDGREWVYNGYNIWEELATTVPTAPVVERTIEEIIFRCVSCGAPTRENGVCPYCGTINRIRKTII